MKKFIYLIAVFFSVYSFAQSKTQNITNQTIIDNPIGDPDPIEIPDPIGDPENPSLSTEVGTTKGELSVTLTGASTYNISVQVPPGINGVEPKVGLSYSSQSGNGIVGYGWNISGLSAITRIPATKSHDGLNDPVDFDTNDRFALDGQRLILKTGIYGALGSTYVTENFSNLNISLILAHSISYHTEGGVTSTIVRRAIFKVEYPDGSIAYYGNSDDSSTDISAALTYWENPQGIRINYVYTKTNNNLYLNNINYGGVGSNLGINKIQFFYKTKLNPEKNFNGGVEIINDKVLSEIKVFGNGVGFRNYALTQDISSGYERLRKIQEKSGDGLKSLNPIIFNYAENENSSKISFTRPNLDPNYNYFLNGYFWGNYDDAYTFPFDYVEADFGGKGKNEFIYLKIDPPTNTNFPNYIDTVNNKIKSNYFRVNYDNQEVIDFDLNLDYCYIPNNINTKIIPGNILEPITYNVVAPNGVDYKIVNKTGLLCLNSYQTIGSSNIVKIRANVFTEDGNGKVNVLEYNKDFDLPNSNLFSDLNKFLGDFNGDGLTDIVFYDRSNSKKFYFVDLDRRKALNFVKDLGVVPSTTITSYFIKTADVNKDNKTDMILFSDMTNEIKIYTLDDSQNLHLLSIIAFDFTGFYGDNSIADFNGDGNIDILLPYHNKILFGNGKNGFVIQPVTDNLAGIAIDFDKNGKTDILKINHTMPNDGNVTLDLYQLKQNNIWEKTTTSFNNVGGYFNLLAVDQNSGSNGSVEMFYQTTYCNLPLPSTSGCLYPKRLSSIKFNNNFQNQKLLNNITSNSITQTITYASLKNANGIYSCANQTENYPNHDLANATSFKVVSQIDKYAGDIHRKQNFKYHGATNNFDGLGFLGFRSILRTNWYSDPSQIISNITKLDISKRGAQVDNFSVLGLMPPTLALTAGTSFISRNETIYNNEDTSYENPLLPNKVFNLKSTFVKQTNGLEGTSKEITTVYNSNNSPTQVTITYKKGTTTEKVTTQTLAYDSVTTPYMIDRLTQKNSTATIFPSGNTTSSEEIYTHTNNLVTQVKKKGDGTDYIIEDNQYDVFGNIIKKTLSSTGLTPRVSSFEYDASGRFLTKKTDIENLITNYTYDSNKGLLLTESFPSITTTTLKNTYTYDIWGKILIRKNIYGKVILYSYANTLDGGGYTITTGEDGSVSKNIHDILGREIRSEVKDINGNNSYVDITYDIYDRIISKSQPYSTTMSVWNEMQYDIYGRIIQASSLKSGSSSGKVVNYSYSGTSTTENDGIKSKITTKNSLNQTISIVETPGGTINYEYFANGNLKSTVCNGATISIVQDGWGNKKELIDPSAGNRKYDYNNFGELIREEAVGHGETIYDLNSVGKVSIKTIKNSAGIIKSKNTYTYNANNKLIGNIRLDDYENSSFTLNGFVYDIYNNVLSTTEELNGKAKFIKTISYDTFGRPSVETYFAQNISDGKSSSKTTTNTYKNGYKWQVLDNTTGLPIWETKTVNAQGQILTATLGNGITITNSYDIYGFPIQSKHDTASTNIMTLNNTFDTIRGNLLTRTNNMFGTWSETLSYDTGDRLTQYKDAIGIQQTQSYNDNGTISSNNLGDHAYTISGKPYQVSTVTPVDQSATSSVLNYYASRTQNITYTTFKSPISIQEATKENIDFEYNIYNGRSIMYYGSLDAVKTNRPYRKYYSADGVMEIKIKTTAPTSVEFTTYIGGDSYSAPAFLKSDGTRIKTYYLHRDYQGTIVGITNALGTVTEKRLFDVWGELIKYQNGVVTTIPTNTGDMLIDRGYTGHEHLLGVNIINMNGRIYDHKFHRFLQPDNNIQEPSNTQNYNRYGYVMNNPTKYTDQSGEFWGWVAGFLFSTYVHGAQATGNPNPLQWNAGQWLNAGLGATSSAVSYSVTNYTNAFIQNYGNPTASQQNYMNENPIVSNVENHSYVSWKDGGSFISAKSGLLYGSIEYTKIKLDMEVEAVYGKEKANSSASIKDEVLMEMAEKVPTLREWYNKSGRPMMYSESRHRFAPSDGISEAKTFLLSDMKNSSMTYFGASFDSYKTLAQNMLHEIGHANFNYNGHTAALVNFYGEYSPVPMAFSEVFAFHFAYNKGGVPYTDNAWYTINYTTYKDYIK